MAQLRARIVELDKEIDLQEELLTKLERDRSLVKRQLNEVADPMIRLPLEISSEIFLRTLSPMVSLKKPSPEVLLLVSICSTWTAIALAISALWTTVDIDFDGPDVDGLADILPFWLQRGGDRSLSVSLRGNFDNWDRCVSAAIWCHAARLKRLEISYDQTFHPDDDLTEEFDLFGDITRKPVPLLETLSIRGSIEDQDGFPGDQIVRLLGRAPNIVECIFLDIRNGNMDHFTYETEGRELVVPTLRRMIFGERDSSCDQIIKFLSLPALQVLSVPCTNIDYDELLQLCKRSAPPLQELALGSPWRSFADEREYLELIPSLARFTIWRPGSQFVVDLFAALVDSPSLLPVLSSLTIDISPHPYHNPPAARDNLEASWQMILHAVSIRRIQLCLRGVQMKPPANVLAACAQMVPDVYICGNW
ncbi:hypothetical protein K438DRAFT_1967023 [Mycena galopus ATCC 62051]|nr:hypothetical protein K438DRAFT_1967023 [Mycena galopus ATCC 62051]